jgi:predicted ATPase
MNNKIVLNSLKIDLHIHSSFSKHKDGDKVVNNTLENLDKLVYKLNENKVNMCAITDHDYFDFELYKKLKEEEKKNNIQKVLPGFEASVYIKGDVDSKVIHIITIFDDMVEEKLKLINSLLVDSNGKPKYDADGKEAYKEETYLDILKNIGLNVVLIAHQKNSPLSKGDMKENDVSTLGKRTFEELVFADYFDSFEFRNKKNQVFNNLYMEKMKKISSVSDVKFITSSDCHDWSIYPKIDKNDNIDDYPYTYLKCLPTFKGLVMSITDYRRISLNPSFFSPSSRYLSEIKYIANGKEKNIELSKGINVIIGDNSIGKSLLVNAITDWKKISPTLKEKYEKYLKTNNIVINTKVNESDIFGFDKQGEIRDNFTNGKLKGKTFLAKYFPSEPNVKLLRAALDSNFLNYFESINSKINYEKKKCELKSFELVIEDNVDNLSFDNNINKLDLSKYKELIDLLDDLKTSYTKLIELDSLFKEDKEKLKLHYEEVVGISKKYEKCRKKDSFENSIIDVIINKVNDLDETLTNIKSDSDKKTDIYTNNISTLKFTLVDLIKLERMAKEYVPNLENKPVPVSYTNIGKYRFIAKTKIESISNEYFYSILSKCFTRGKLILYEDMDEQILIDKIKDYNDDSEGPIEFLKKRIKKLLDEDFKCKNVINLKDDKDLYSELSNGFDSRIYFDMLSNQKSMDGIYIIDQPEDDVSQSAIKEYLLDNFKKMGSNRQIIIITHNPQFIVNLDVDNVIAIQKKGDTIDIQYGALEYEDNDCNIIDIIANSIDGGIDTINKRWKRYDKTTEND